MGIVGIEPTLFSLRDCCFSGLSYIPFAELSGFEPEMLGLESNVIPDFTTTLYLGEQWDSNPYRSCHRGELYQLSYEHHLMNFVRMIGFEPIGSRIQTERFTGLSYTLILRLQRELHPY